MCTPRYGSARYRCPFAPTLRQLASDSLKGLSHIDVDTDHHGVVTLKGKVPTQDAADRAISIARATDGVRTVKSTLKVKIDD
jgi:hyperosmotically inducible periplasmic protein